MFHQVKELRFKARVYKPEVCLANFYNLLQSDEK